MCKKGYTITSQDLEQPSTFVHYKYCQWRLCDGGPFQGDVPGRYVWNSEEFNTQIEDLLSLKLTHLKFDYYTSNSRRVRTITNSYAQYENGVSHACCFAYPFVAFIGTDETEFNRIDNELPSELGVTYNLSKEAGLENVNHKHITHGLLPSLRLSEAVKYEDNKKYVAYGSMNSGTRGSRDVETFTRLSSYSMKRALYILEKSEPLRNEIT